MTFDLLSTATRQAGAVEHAGHRPWALPEEPWTSAMTWIDLAFLHWRVDPDEVRKLLPDEVELETFDDAAWLGVVPFVMTGVRLRGIPPLPRLSTFPELNVRTYVRHEDRGGIWFFSLDAESRLFVEGAKWQYKLPYHYAEMTRSRAGDHVHYESARPGAAFSGNYRGVGDLFSPEPGSLEHFLTERYCLYTSDGGRLYRADIHHAPWALQGCEANVDLNTMSPVQLPDEEPHALFSPRQDTVVWPLRPI